MTGDDVEGILGPLVEALELNPSIVEKRMAVDKKRRRLWLEFCAWRCPPIIMPAGRPTSNPVTIPEEVVKAGSEAIEDYARDFARDWDRAVELFVRNHIRFVVRPSGQMDVNEMGYCQPWLEP